MDRIDLVVDVPAVALTMLTRPAAAEGSAAVRCRVARARERQRERFGSWRLNAEIESAEVMRLCRPDQEARRLLETAADQMGLSARGYDRVLRVSRTIADLAGAEGIEVEHVAEALQYRMIE